MLCAYDVPILDTLTKSSDPYVRLELYPRYLFPLNQFPAQTSRRKFKINKQVFRRNSQTNTPTQMESGFRNVCSFLFQTNIFSNFLDLFPKITSLLTESVCV